jgi:hypothetical protein
MDWLADGGILDNSPFDPVLQAISQQPVESTWNRTLCYVVPSADEAKLGEDVDTVGAKVVPPAWTSVLAKAIGLPNEADLRDDFTQLHNSLRGGRSNFDVTRFQRLLKDAGVLKESVEFASVGFVFYRENRAAAAIYEICDLVASRGTDSYLLPAEQVDPSTVRDRRPWLPDAFPSEVEEEWRWGLDAATRMISVFLRSLAHADEVDDDLRRSLTTVKLRVAAVREYVFDRIASGTLDADSSTLVADAAQLADDVFTAAEVPGKLGILIREAVDAYAEYGPDRHVEPVDVLHAALCVEVANGVGGAPVDIGTGPLFDFVRMGISSEPTLFTTARKQAQQRYAQEHNGQHAPASTILYGTRLNHFGAFGKREWRQWDWMWGRLHAVVHLATILGLRDTEVDQLAELIVRAEGYTPDQVARKLDDVVNTSGQQFMAELKAERIVAPALDAVFALFGSRRGTQPPLRAELRWPAALGARKAPPAMTAGQRVARFAASIPRHLLYRRVGR